MIQNETWHDFIYIQVADGSCRRCTYGDVREFQASLSDSKRFFACSARKRKRTWNMFQQRFRRQTNITWCRVKCISVFPMPDASFLSCKTLHVNFWIILMLYPQTMSCILVLLNVSKAEEKERRLASTIESMQASHILQNTTLRSRFGQSVSVTKKSETIAYFANFATPVLNPPRLIDAFLQADKEKLEKLLETAKQEVRVPGSKADNATKKQVVFNQSWRCSSILSHWIMCRHASANKCYCTWKSCQNMWTLMM